MIKVVEQLRRLRHKGMRQAPVRGSVPMVGFTNYPTVWWGLQIFVVSAFVVFVGSWITLTWMGKDSVWGPAGHYGITAGLVIALLYYILPILHMLGFMLLHRQRPARYVLAGFAREQKIVCLGLMAFGLFYLFNHLYPVFDYALRQHHWPRYWWHHWWDVKPYVTVWWHVVVICFCIALVLAFLLPFLFPKELKRRKKRLRAFVRRALLWGDSSAYPFGLWLGRSTGLLSCLWHRSGMAFNLDIVLSTEDAAQNILVLGGIGSGKTTRLMQPMLIQLLDQGCGGLLFDVKGDVKHAAIQLAELVGSKITIIGPNHNQMNLLAGLTPEVAASFLKSAFLLGGGTRIDEFWIDTATELCRNTLGVLSFLPEHYTLQGLYSYLFDDDARDAMEEKLSALLITLEANNETNQQTKQQRLLETYMRYHRTIFAAFDEKVKSGVNATVAQALSPFNHPELIDAFCQQMPNTQETQNTEKTQNQDEDPEISASLDMQAVLDGVVYLVDMPLSRWGLGAKVAYTFIKLRFFNVMQSRNQNPDWNQERPVFFMCDEYQELVSASKDGLSDLNFWDKSRSSKTLGMISAQSVSSFYAALGDRDLTHALLQNFRQKICFRTEDQATLTMMDALAGRAKVQRMTVSQTTGSSSRGWSGPVTSTSSSTQSIVEARESVLDATLFRNLTSNQAVVLLSLQGRSMDDVLELLPVFIK